MTYEHAQPPPKPEPRETIPAGFGWFKRANARMTARLLEREASDWNPEDFATFWAAAWWVWFWNLVPIAGPVIVYNVVTNAHRAVEARRKAR